MKCPVRTHISWFSRMLTISVLFVFFYLLHGRYLVQYVQFNWRHLTISRVWLNTSYRGESNDSLQDGVPDGWQYYAWGNATQILELNVDDVVAGNRALKIEHTNTNGGAGIIQVLPLKGNNTPELFTIYAKGGEGVVHIWYRIGSANDWIKKGGRLSIPPNDDWRQYRMAFVVPTDASDIAVLLQVQQITEFDEAYLGSDNGTSIGKNLLINPGFEYDGESEDVLAWWDDNVLADNMSIQLMETTGTNAFSNVNNILNGNYAAIQQHTGFLGHPCALEPGEISWLVAKGPQFRDTGGSTAEEKVYQLAMRLAPNCPQPYAALAELYKGNFAFKRAADLYEQAANLSTGTVFEGKYSFEAGFLRLRNTGEMKEAIELLRRAEQTTGWEGGEWYQGAATYYLGIALQETGQIDQSRLAFQRVINCRKCYFHRSAARRALNELRIEKVN